MMSSLHIILFVNLNSSLNSLKSFISVVEVGEAVNELNENVNDTTENDLDDDVDIPWSVEQRKGSLMIKDQMKLNHKLRLALERLTFAKKYACFCWRGMGAMPQCISDREYETQSSNILHLILA